ncbi:hypothetical protein [Streptomyces sp. CBMA123]|uniref:hypothetical protein n=1 Tax=Streptomyces sp. CBMA123 TaxID=1896313 RepID=UPI001661AF2F|nr:hypothetical protein [Streptomyces sp. CBMA123]MBD0694314.1 hypothetical protein [Streptomyces sp. CBMA123]
MSVRHTLNIMDWHDDGSSTWLRWVVSADQMRMVRDLLDRAPDAEGVVTPEQADQARTATDRWVTWVEQDWSPPG